MGHLLHNGSEKAAQALALSVNLVKEPAFDGDLPNDIVLRHFGHDEDHDSRFYLAITAESLRDAAINTLDVTLNLGTSFSERFALSPEKIYFANDHAEQRCVHVCDSGNGPRIHFEGAGLEDLGNSDIHSSLTVLAYIELRLRSNFQLQIQQHRNNAQFRGLNHPNTSAPFSMDMEATVDQVVFSDLLSLHNLTHHDVLIHPMLDLSTTATTAQTWPAPIGACPSSATLWLSPTLRNSLETVAP